MNKVLQDYIENNYYITVGDVDKQAWADWCKYYDENSDTDEKEVADDFITDCYKSMAIDDGQENAKLELKTPDELPFSKETRTERTIIYTWNGCTVTKKMN